MQTFIKQEWLQTDFGREANDILRKCVHCGFCIATCPTYGVQGDELDSPRGRIYLIKQLLEGNETTDKTQLHLDRCLTCRSCETTCPSGVEYSHLLDIGRNLIEEQVQRPVGQRLQRKLLAWFLNAKNLFNFWVKVGRGIKFILPEGLRRNLSNNSGVTERPTRAHRRKMLLLEGCVQPALAPNINQATAKVLDGLGIEISCIKNQSCCGAVNWHLSETESALKQMRDNIDAWMPAIDSGAEAIVINASACAATVKDYAHYLRADKNYSEKAKRVSSLAKDLSEVLAVEDLSRLKKHEKVARVAFHPPCTLQHGQRIDGIVEQILESVGYQLTSIKDKHLCCGSAGSYSVLQKDLARKLRQQKLESIHKQQPEMIATANIGCLLHLQSGTDIEVKHWIELLSP